MSYDFSTAPGIVPSSFSRTQDGATLTALGATMALGTASGTNGIYAQMRFDTTALRDKDILVDLQFRAVAATAGSNAYGFELWAVDYGTAPTLTTADYAKAISNGDLASPFKNYAVRIGELIPAGPIVAGDVFTLEVPPRFVNCEGIYSGYTDLEIRPAVSGVPAAAHTAVLHSLTAATAADRPSLVGISMTENELLAEGNGYREDMDPAEYVIAVGMQPSARCWVKPVHILPRTDGDMGYSADNLMSAQTHSSRATSAHMVPGPVSAGGSINLELTPEVWAVLLRGMCKLYSTTSLGGGRYKHVFRIAKAGDLKRYTVYQREADWSHKIFPDVVLSSLNLNITPGGLIQLGVSLPAIFPISYSEVDAGGATAPFLLSSLAARDENPPLSFVGVEAEITTPSGMVFNAEHMSNIGVSLAQDVGGKPGFNRKRHGSGHTFGGVGAAFNFSAYTENELLMREHFGLDSATEYPYVCGKEVNFHDAEVRLWGPEGDYLQGYVIKFPRFATATVNRPIPAGGQVMTSVQAAGLHSDTVEGSFELEYYTTEPASFFDPSTDYLEILPGGYAYNSRIS